MANVPSDTGGKIRLKATIYTLLVEGCADACFGGIGNKFEPGEIKIFIFPMPDTPIPLKAGLKEAS